VPNIIKIGIFAAQIIRRWWGEMSGATSIPLAFIALLQQGHERRFFALLAFCALWVCVIKLAWMNYQLLEKQKPKFRLSCGKDIIGCNVPSLNGSMQFFRLCVEAQGQNEIKNCRGHLIKIEKDGNVVFGHDSLILTFARAEDPDTLAKTLHPNIPEFLDVLCTVNVVHTVCTADKNRTPALDQNRDYVFSLTGDYILTVAVSGDGVPPATAKLKFTWKGQWMTASIEKIK
jgi:hypothetical protein